MTPKNILVVDPEDCLPSALQLVLTQDSVEYDACPHIVRSATNLTGAVTQLADHRIDMAVIVQSADQYLRIVQQVHAHDADLPIVVIRDSASKDPNSKIIEGGAVDVFPSSYNCDEPYELAEMLKNVLVRVTIPNGKANSAMLKHLDTQFGGIRQELGSIRAAQAVMDTKLSSVDKQVQEMRTKVDQQRTDLGTEIGTQVAVLDTRIAEHTAWARDHMVWHNANKGLTEMIREPANWASKNKTFTLVLVFLLSVSLALATRTGMLQRWLKVDSLQTDTRSSPASGQSGAAAK